MGVPAFFRWLSKKCPSIVVHCVEEKAKQLDGVNVPVDTSKPNPNDYEFDNLYLDMNGIIHPCCHPENKPAPKNEDEMMVLIFEYIDRIFSIVRPRKLLYMAIDGVAPRAKMNQQRSRRFRASKEAVEKVDDINRIREELITKGAELPPVKEKTEHFDSNCITPGTEFMDNLSICLRYYISERLNNDPGWKDIKVILSDANVPGEGEHKIMDYIRKQRASPDHDPNTRHCLNGADADLIMLGLATHEPHFTIIREEFKPNQPRPCEICNQVGHNMQDCQGLPREKRGEHDELPQPITEDVEFIFIRLNVLREYLERDLRMDGLPFGYDFERCVDDWVFMCFFVGNDFLPHLPSLEIREGAIDRLVGIYKRALPRLGGYLADSGFVDLKRVEKILSDLGQMEDEIFRKRQERELEFRRREKQKKERMKRQRLSDGPLWTPQGQFRPVPIGNTPSPINSPRQEAFNMRKQSMSPLGPNQRAANDLRAMLSPASSSRGSTPNSTPDGTPVSTKRPLPDDEKEDEEPKDDIRLWEDGWKGRYYLHKFGVDPEDDDYSRFRKQVADAYVEGLCWVLRYYYQGCPSWKWFYPFHYAPFASDFRELESVKIDFDGKAPPFNPLEQLMGVFPAASGNFLPPTWRELMSHPKSPIIDFYPTDFQIDLNGKKYAWQGVALLPFVDERRLLKSLKDRYPDLTEEERRRNSRGLDRLFVGRSNPAFDFFVGLYEGNNPSEEVDCITELTQKMSGKVILDDQVHIPGEVYECPLPNLYNIKNNQSISMKFKDPVYAEGYVYKARVLTDAVMPDRVLKPEGMGRNESYRPTIGMNSRRTQGASLGNAGHRMMNFYAGPTFNPNSLLPHPGYQGGRQHSDDRRRTFGGVTSYQQNWGQGSPASNYRGGYQQRGGYQDQSSFRSPNSFQSPNNNRSPGYHVQGANYQSGYPRDPRRQSSGQQYNRNNQDDRRRSYPPPSSRNYSQKRY